MQLFEEMRGEGCVPNVISYNSLITACAQGAARGGGGGGCVVVCVCVVMALESMRGAGSYSFGCRRNGRCVVGA